MPNHHRSKAFSGKQKKAQLQQKRLNKQRKTPITLNIPSERGDDESDGSSLISGENPPIERGAAGDGKLDRHEKFKLLFQSETREELDKAKERAQTDEIIFDELNNLLWSEPESIQYPCRPDWGDAKKARQIEKLEEDYFTRYLEKVHSEYGSSGSLSFFEHNLETWRQLWRTVEAAHVVAVVADVRFPLLHINPSFLAHLTQTAKKVVIILSKVDLVRPELYAAWKTYLTERYGFPVVGFTCFDRFAYRENKHIQRKRHRAAKFGNQFASALGPLEFARTVSELCPEAKCDEWIEMLERNERSLSSESELEPIKIGLCGQTNVGKSSIMNALVGEKHFSMSSRPGHTKTLQTWSVTPDVTLIDSPGLIFPSLWPRQLQILSGLYPIDQVRAPFAAVGYLGQRVDLVAAFQLRHVSDEKVFTAWDLAESLAVKKNFIVARKKYPDAYRGANLLLRMAVQGQIVMAHAPPDFQAAAWADNQEVTKLKSMAKTEHDTRRVAQTNKQITSSSEDQEENDESESDEETVNNRFALLDC